jgi:hypothetical protein
MRLGGEERSGAVTLGEVPTRILDNMGNVFGRDAGALILPAIYRGSRESGMEVFGMNGETGALASSMGGSRATFWVSLVLSAIAGIGLVRAIRNNLSVGDFVVVITLAIVVVVPARTFRYILPLAPFLVFYFLRGLEAIAAAARSTTCTFGPPSRIAVMCILVLFGMEHTQYIWMMRNGSAPVWLAEYRDVKGATDWLKANLAGEGHVASNNPGLVYLTTGRKGLSMGNARAHWQSWQAGGVRYAVAISPAPTPPRALGYRMLFESPDRQQWILEMQGPLTESDKAR